MASGKQEMEIGRLADSAARAEAGALVWRAAQSVPADPRR